MSTYTKYESLVNVLDAIRAEAPSKMKRYNPSDSSTEKINYARSRAFLHLYLKVKFGILEFTRREYFVTDGTGDGGIDAYYIDEQRKKILFLQAKFCTTEDNFEEKHISLDEILSIEVNRVMDGESHDESGLEYNGKIKQLQRETSNLPDIGRYSYEVVLLANLGKTKKSKLQRLTGGFPVDIFDYESSYNELVFPIVSGTYYNEPELRIILNLINTTSSSARISYSVNTAFKRCDVTLVFVPTSEVGRIMYQYKNSILKYNPRSYLELSKNEVNRDISSSITDLTTNEFALFNNGITMLSDETNFNEQIGAPDKAQVIVTNPQIINGGQTAYTLSRLYEKVLGGSFPEDLFTGKEVLLKIITFDIEEQITPEDRLHLIENISKATNSQTEVTPADRRSNDKIQIDLQTSIFQQYGQYYERKLGEFADGIRDSYIHENQIINRETFLRVSMACNLRVAKARRNSIKQIFTEDNINSTYNDQAQIPEYFYGYVCYQTLNQIKKTIPKNVSDKYGIEKYGQALRYGKYAVVAVCSSKTKTHAPSKAKKQVQDVLASWRDFEKNIYEEKHNSAYFQKTIDPTTGEIKHELNYSNYYKGRTIADDLKTFFSI